MDHSSFIYLVAPDGKTAAILPPQMTPETMAEQIEAVMAGA
jgi:cytochrome oxidase Cu insertion factor (SCO1/SenC/PrrC family)